MANNTDEAWDIDGVSLHQFGWSISTLGGSRLSLPPLRGEDIAVAYRAGKTWRPKLADSRPMTLMMWLEGSDPATGNPAADPHLQWMDSWMFLRRLLWKPRGAQISLTRRWRETVGGTPTLLSATAQAQIAGSMEPTMMGNAAATFAVDLILADPYFYGPQITAPVTGSVTVTNPGDDDALAYGMSIDLAAGCTLTNTTPSPHVVVSSPAAVTLDLSNFSVSPGSAAGGVVHSGARAWMGLQPGANTLVASGGSATIRFRPPYV